MNHGGARRVQNFIGDVFEGAIHGKAPALNLLACLLLVHDHWRLRVLRGQLADAGGLVHDNDVAALASWFLAVVDRPLASDFRYLRTSVPPAVATRTVTSLWHVEVAGAHTDLGVAADIHTLAAIREVGGVYVFVFCLVDSCIVSIAT